MGYSKRTARKAPVRVVATQSSRSTPVARTASGKVVRLRGRVLSGSPRAIATLYAKKARVSPYRFR